MLIYSLLSVILSYFTFPNHFFLYGFWPLGWVALVLLFPALEKMKFSHRWVAGGLFGLIFYGLLVAWFIPYSLFGYILFVASLSLQPVLFFGLYGFRPQRYHADLIFVPALWVSTELLRSFFLKGFSWSLSCSQAFQPLNIQTASFWGPWGISFLMVLVNYCFYKLIWTKNSRKVYWTAIFVSLIIVFGFGFFTLHINSKRNELMEPFRILAVQPNVDFKEKNEPLFFEKIIHRQVALTKIGAKQYDVGLVVWPETSIPANLSTEPLAMKAVYQLARSIKAYVLVGAVLTYEGLDYNSAVLLNPQGDVIHVYHKRYLVPFSEYVPQGLFWERMRSLFRINSYDFIPGEGPGVFSLSGEGGGGSRQNVKIGVGICNEDLLGGVFHGFKKNKADFALILSNDGWFRRPEALVLHTQCTVMNAVSSRIPVLRVTNTGWTCFIDSSGRVQGPLVPFNEEATAKFLMYPDREGFN